MLDDRRSTPPEPFSRPSMDGIDVFVVPDAGSAEQGGNAPRHRRRLAVPKGVMRTVALVAISALLGGLVGALAIYLVVEDIVRLPGKLAIGARSQPSSATRPAAKVGKTQSGKPQSGKPQSAPPGTDDGEWGAQLNAASRVVAAGRLREAQEMYLAVLLVDPTHQAAMRGLVRVVQLMSGGDRAALRRQAEEYRQAITLGLETEEHYTAPAMELLARASLQAAGVPSSSTRRTARSSPAQTAPQATRAQPQSRPAQPAAPPKPKPTAQPPAPKPRTTAPTPSQSPPKSAPPAAPSAPAPPTPAPSPSVPFNVNEPFVTVTVGPMSSGEQASAMTAELTIAGYSARVRRQEAGSYIITLGPYRQSVAARAAAYIKSRFGQNLPVALTPAP